MLACSNVPFHVDVDDLDRRRVVGRSTNYRRVSTDPLLTVPCNSRFTVDVLQGGSKVWMLGGFAFRFLFLCSDSYRKVIRLKIRHCQMKKDNAYWSTGLIEMSKYIILPTIFTLGAQKGNTNTE